MNTNQNLLRLMTWLSPVFPTGGFAYSHGLEAAISAGQINDREGLVHWLEALIGQGSIWNDCVLLVEAARLTHQGQTLNECAKLARALAGSKERLLETSAQGAAFVTAAQAWMGEAMLPDDCPLPVAIGAVAALNDVDIEAALNAYLHAFISNQVQAALRLMKLGQTNGVWVQKALEPAILRCAARASRSSLDDLGSATIMAEIAAMRHETMASRIFRS